MGEPPHFVETRPEILHGLILACILLGLLISVGLIDLVADPVLFLLDPDFPPSGRLRAHVARANGHWRLLAERPDAPVLVVFRARILHTPVLVRNEARDRRQWSRLRIHSMVQSTASPPSHEGADWLGEQIGELTATHEASHAHPWAVGDAPEAHQCAEAGHRRHRDPDHANLGKAEGQPEPVSGRSRGRDG